MYGVKGFTHSIWLQFGSGRVYSVRYMFTLDMILWAVVDRSILASAVVHCVSVS